MHRVRALGRDLDELESDLAIGEPVALRTSKLRGQACLSGASRPQHGQKTGVRQNAAQLTHFFLASDEAGRAQGDTSGSAHDPQFWSGGQVMARTERPRNPTYGSVAATRT